MRKFVAVAGILWAGACAETSGPPLPDRQYTIDVPGNVAGTPGCTSVDLISCFAVLDNQIKLLYEQAAWAARVGEAHYRVITNSNRDLAAIFQSDTTTVREAVRALDDFTAAMEKARARAQLSACWGDYLIGFGRWIRGKVAAADVDVSDAPAQECRISPIAGVAASGSTAQGVVLKIDDPWHYSGDPYGVYATRTHFVVQGPHGSIKTAPVEQQGAASVVVTDSATNAVGTYPYTVVQCSDWGYCSAPVTFVVDVIEGDGLPACVHDNRDRGRPGLFDAPRCEVRKN